MPILNRTKTTTDPDGFTVPDELKPFYTEPTDEEIGQLLSETDPSNRATVASARAHLRGRHLTLAASNKANAAAAAAHAAATTCRACGRRGGGSIFGTILCDPCADLASARIAQRRYEMLAGDVQKRLDTAVERYLGK